MQVNLTCLTPQPVPMIGGTAPDGAAYQNWPALFQLDVSGFTTPDAPGWAYIYVIESVNGQHGAHLAFGVIGWDGSYQLHGVQFQSKASYQAIAEVRPVVNGAYAGITDSDPITITNAV